MAFVAGTDLSFQVDLINADGQAIVASSVEYRVLDELGTVRADWAALAGYTLGQPATINVPASVNALEVAQTKAGREIELRCTEPSGTVQLASKFYVIESSGGQLIRGVNTLVTLGGAELLAHGMPQMTAWGRAGRAEKTVALLEGYRRLGKLRFTELDNFWYDRAGPLRRFTATSLSDLSQSEVLSLDPKALSAIALGQVSEADAVLSSDGTEARRQEGLILETVGEVKQMFRNGKPLDLPVSRRTLSYVSAYMTIGTKIIGRTS